MIIASVWHAKRFLCVEYACAVAICARMVLFVTADWELTPHLSSGRIVARITVTVTARYALPTRITAR